MRTFDLFPEPSHFWSLNDYGAVVDAVERFKPGRVLEFGPGSSTLALIEGGAGRIDCLEDNPDWFAVYLERLEHRFPGVVALYDYSMFDNVVVAPGICDRRYDFALVDGPFGTVYRYGATRFALGHADVVMACTEDEGRKEQSVLRPQFEQLAIEFSRRLEYVESGPMAGGFAIFTREQS